MPCKGRDLCNCDGSCLPTQRSDTELLERCYEVLKEAVLADSGHDEQDTFELEVFEDLKRRLGK